MIKILPPSTQPWRLPIERRHTPAAVAGPAGYQLFRACLRWEFGFSCPFCLLHEADFIEYGIEGWKIEHAEPMSTHEELKSVYDNCFYSCRFCIISRGKAPVVDGQRRRLLNPCRDVWGEFFELRGDEIQPRRRDDSDAHYTLQVYDLNDPRKVAMRKHRRETIEECRRIVNEVQLHHDRALSRARDTGDPEMVDLARVLWQSLRSAYEDLERYVPVPLDADQVCRCGRTDHLSIPKVLEEQTILGLDERFTEVTRRGRSATEA